METFFRSIDIRWSDLDPNFHVLHSKYYDFGAYARISFLTENGLSMPELMKHGIGPILFREECVFRRELRFGDPVFVDLSLKKITGDYSRWTMEHRLWKNSETLAAVITVDGAWLNTTTRKLAGLPAEFHALFNEAPKTDDFHIY